MSSGEKPKFTILWIEDNPQTMTEQEAEIKDYLTKINFEPVLIHDITGTEALGHLQKTNIDLILADKNIQQHKTSISLIQKIRRKNFLIDVLFYSRDGVKEKDVTQLTQYSSVDIVRDSKLIPRVKKLINKNIMKWNDMIFLRGIVISRIIEMELQINSFFIYYFHIPTSRSHHFAELMMEGGAMSFQGKKEALDKIVRKNGWRAEFKKLDEMLGTLQRKRNYIAHCRQHPKIKNSLIHMGDDKNFTKKDMDEIFDFINKSLTQIDALRTKYGEKRKGTDSVTTA